MYYIYAQWLNGSTECVDDADSKAEAALLVNEYCQAFSGKVKSVWWSGGSGTIEIRPPKNMWEGWVEVCPVPETIEV